MEIRVKDGTIVIPEEIVKDTAWKETDELVLEKWTDGEEIVEITICTKAFLTRLEKGSLSTKRC